MNEPHHILAVPYDLGVSGTIVFALRLCEQLELMGMKVAVAVVGRSTFGSNARVLEFDSDLALLEWLSNRSQQISTVCWCGFFHNAYSREAQITLSSWLVGTTGLSISYLWERTGAENPVPEHRMFQAVCMHARAILALNLRQLDELQQRGAPPDIVRLLATGVDTRTQYMPCSSAKRDDLRDSFGWHKDQVVFLSLSRLTRRKRVDALVHAWKNLEILPHTAYLLIVGSGFDAPDSVEEEIRRLVASLDSVGFLKYHDGLDRKQFFQSADVLVSTGVLEGEPTVLVEAMACGLPVLASKEPGHARLVDHGRTGLLFPSNDWRAFERAVCALCASREKRILLGSAAREQAVRTRDIRVVAHAFATITIRS